MHERDRQAFEDACAAEANQLQQVVDNQLKRIELSPSIDEDLKKKLTDEASRIQETVKFLRSMIIQLS